MFFVYACTYNMVKKSLVKISKTKRVHLKFRLRNNTRTQEHMYIGLHRKISVQVMRLRLQRWRFAKTRRDADNFGKHFLRSFALPHSKMIIDNNVMFRKRAMFFWYKKKLFCFENAKTFFNYSHFFLNYCWTLSNK